MSQSISLLFCKQEAQLLLRDHAMRNVSSNLNTNHNPNPNPHPNEPNPVNVNQLNASTMKITPYCLNVSLHMPPCPHAMSTPLQLPTLKTK